MKFIATFNFQHKSKKMGKDNYPFNRKGFHNDLEYCKEIYLIHQNFFESSQLFLSA